jgi:predicted ferric reductase
VGAAGPVGAQRTAHGVIESLQTYPALNVLETTLRMDPGWPGHRPGQFAFAMSNPKEGPHPYTLASAWVPEDRRITFITKALGDHTRRLPERLRVGDQVTVEGLTAASLSTTRRPARSGSAPASASRHSLRA